MATLRNPVPSRQSRKLVEILQSVGIDEFDPDKAAVIRTGRQTSNHFRDTPTRWYLHQPGVYHLHIDGADTLTNILRHGAEFTFWHRLSVRVPNYGPGVHIIDVFAREPSASK